MAYAIIEALQNLYVALGGTASDVANITTTPDMINAIAKLDLSATAELPAVTGSDNGDILAVSGGKWAKTVFPAELPAVTGDDDGKVLTVVDGAWTAAAATPAAETTPTT